MSEIETAKPRRGEWLWLTLACLPFAAGIVVAIIFAASGSRVTLDSSSPIATVVIVSGLVLSAIALGVRWAVHKARDAYARGLAEGTETQRQEHRRFLARLDHELKNPITAMRAALAAVDDTDRSPHLAAVDGQARRMTGLVGDLRKLTELETEPIEREIVRLDDLARDAVAALQEQHDVSDPSTALRIAVVFPEAPWPLPPVQGDMDLLFLALYNLVSNAAKYSGPGASIEVRGSEDEGWVQVEVADTGRGIPSGDLPFVWDELARGENARGVPGSGLGLPLVRAIVLRHGGEVSIRSREGTGTSVRLRFPAHPAA